MSKTFRKLYFTVLTLLVTLMIPLVVFAAGKDIIILHTNDIHCGVNDNLGIDKVARYKKELKKQGYPVVLVDAGDAIQGAPIGKLSDGASIIKILNAAGYDFAIPGNHEFDYGMDRFLQLAGKLKCGYYSSNFINVKDRKLVLKPYKIMSLGEKKIAFVGVTTPETLVTSTPKFFQDNNGKFVYGFSEDQNGEKVYRAVQRAVNNARKDGADYVFVVGHLGTNGSIPYWTSGAMAANTYNVDAFIDGHSHEQYIPPHKVVNKVGKEVLVAQTGTKLETVGKMTINEDGAITSVLVKDLKNADLKVTKVVAKENKKFDAILNQPAGETLVDLTINDPKTGKRRVRNSETNLGDFVTDAYRTVLNIDIALENGGSIRETIKKGVFTYNDLLAAFPYGNMCTVVEATGQQIVDALEVGASNYPGEHGGFMQVSGMTYTIDSSVPSGVVLDAKGCFMEVKGERRVKDVKVGGKPIDLNGKYTVGGSNYILKDGGNGLVMFKQSKLLKDAVMTDIDAIMEYAQNHLNAKVKDGYENPYGTGRIIIK
ncbi:MAG: bifunctional metallophosphatase/5'-nucleotidase [Acidaminococcaceae bacterium]|nr:bifunctional metallophosphatase/5'-nucleotidase [Acidaminococcaceae bacterium]